MRRFYLTRDEDVSGVSGTGRVAEGVEWEDGKVSVSWLSRYHIVETIDNIHTCEAVHGHGGKTKVEWLD